MLKFAFACRCIPIYCYMQFLVTIFLFDKSSQTKFLKHFFLRCPFFTMSALSVYNTTVNTIRDKDGPNKNTTAHTGQQQPTVYFSVDLAVGRLYSFPTQSLHKITVFVAFVLLKLNKFVVLRRDVKNRKKYFSNVKKLLVDMTSQKSLFQKWLVLGNTLNHQHTFVTH